MISSEQPLKNRIRNYRVARGWSQEELARRSGVSRAGISAIEIERLAPSAAAALALAAVFDCRVEDLFCLGSFTADAPAWAWPPTADPCRFWQAEVGGTTWLYPAEATSAGALPHDGLWHAGQCRHDGPWAAGDTLVVACCDPAASLLAAEFARTSTYRMLVLPRSSREALDLLGQGRVHVAGVHLAASTSTGGNAETVRDRLGAGYSILRAACWEEGVAIAPKLHVRSVRAALRGKLRWVGRQPGSGAQQCLDELLGNRPSPRHVARDHRSVADAIRTGWADAGVCLRLVSEEQGLDFLSVRQEAYELCFPATMSSDPRVRALLAVVRSASYRRMLAELPGYDSSQTGEFSS